MSEQLHFSDKYHRPYLMGISIILVFLFHLGLFIRRYDGVELHLLNNFFGKGHFGVDVFLFLSAYGLSYSINKNSLKKFYQNRLARIMPTYIVFLVLCISLFFNDSWSVALRYFFSAVTGLSCITIGGFPLIEWYVPSLIFVYAFFPVINWLSKKIVNYKAGSLSIYLSICIIALHTILYHSYIGIYQNLSHRIPIILLGSLCFQFDTKKDNRKIPLIAILALFGIFLFHGNYDRVTLAIPAVLYVVGKVQKLPLHNIISIIGKYSLEIYLAQVITTKYFMLVYKGDIGHKLVCCVILTILLSFVFAYVSRAFKTLLWKLSLRKDKV